MKMGSFLIIGLKGLFLSREEENLIEKEGIGGVILFERNCESYLQLKDLCLKLNRLKTPLIIAVDREGPAVDRFKRIKKFYPWPHPSTLKNLNQIEQSSYFLHQELKHIGVNMNLSPCLDILNKKSSVLNGRAFSSSPERTAIMGKAFIQGARRAGVLSCAKHFPGHGGVAEDSHQVLPIDSRSREKVMEFMLPFRQAISEKISGIMLAHILYPAIDSLIAPLSKKIVNHLKNMNFSNLILTDDLDMGALHSYSTGQFVSQSLQAGVHMMIIGQNSSKIFEILDYLKRTEGLRPVLELRNKEIMILKKKHLMYLRPSSFPPLHPKRSAWFEMINQ